ncbi:MAG: glucosaminidase domain-containing protein [Alphaproteobacteria bacterium]
MHKRLKRLRFEYTSLGFVVLSVVLLYGLALSGPAAVIRDGDILAAWVVRAPQSMVMAWGSAVGEVSIRGLEEYSRRVDYRLGGVRRGEHAVPRILVDRIPPELAMLRSPRERKRAFVKVMLPLVLAANERILAERRRLIELRGKSGAFEPGERAWLEHMSARYNLETPDVEALLRRVDAVPPSLALAQAAEESGWGTSRFVREGNALFGQRTFAAGSGLIPLQRDESETHEVRSFKRLLDSVASYMTNLNSHYAYDEFRKAREEQRKIRDSLDGYALARTLTGYSERGAEYTRTIRSIIRSNGLRALDRARFRDREDSEI